MTVTVARKRSSRSTRSRLSRFGVRSAGFLLLKILAALVGATVLVALLLRFVPVYFTGVMVERRIESFSSDKPYQSRHHWVSWDKISPQVALAVVAAEDQKFPDHHGFDFESIEKAIDAHEKGRRLRGASTISQQVAKNVFLWSGRSFVRKGLEAYYTVLIELTWPKRRILEVYLNSIELGDGVYGVEAASQKFFHKPAARLRADEAALLAAVLPNPRQLRVDRPSGYVLERRGRILDFMADLGGTGYIKRVWH